MPWNGVTFGPMPITGNDTFDYFFGLVFFFGIVAFGLRCLFSLFDR
jgi:hypothetical protein